MELPVNSQNPPAQPASRAILMRRGRDSRKRQQVFAETVRALEHRLERVLGSLPCGRNAPVRSFRPAAVSVTTRLRRSRLSTATLISRRRSNGLRLAVKVVRSIASNVAIAAIGGGTGPVEARSEARTAHWSVHAGAAPRRTGAQPCAPRAAREGKSRCRECDASARAKANRVLTCGDCVDIN